MFELALAIGAYSYLILFLGLLGKLYFLPVVIISIGFWSLTLWLLNKKLSRLEWGRRRNIFVNRLSLLILVILIFQALINLIGALAPELSFDALWYHLTLPKLYVENQRVFYVPGGLLYYSSMPRLVEMLYTTALILKDEILAKLIHWSFGILSGIALFNLLKRYFKEKFSLLGVLIFYTLLVVSWQSTTAYVDLARTFFEILALFYFLRWFEERRNWLFRAGLMMGLSLSTKHLSLESLFVFLVLIFLLGHDGLVKNLWQFLIPSFGLALPWYILSYFNTGNPFYPLFLGWFEVQQIGDFNTFIKTHNPMTLLISLWQTTFNLDNLLTPVFLLLLPLILVKISQQGKITKIAALYFLFGYIFWFFTPPSSARYLLPFIPALIFVCLRILLSYRDSIQKIVIGVIVLASLLNLGARVMATKKFLPVILGKETRGEFLSRNLNFDFGDFYDIDGFFAQNIRENDLVLIYNIHNLYYVDFPFVHETWAKPRTYFTHILIKDIDLPEKFGDLELLYQNKATGVKLYQYEDFYK